MGHRAQQIAAHLLLFRLGADFLLLLDLRRQRTDDNGDNQHHQKRQRIPRDGKVQLIIRKRKNIVDADYAHDGRQKAKEIPICEAGNQPYEGQVAVGAVVMNRIKSSSYPDTMEEVIYQSGQFSPAMSGWLDRVRANQGYTEAAMQAAEDALAGSNPIGDCLYFSVGGYGTRIGDHLFH